MPADDYRFDKRVVNRNLRKGLVKRDEHKQYIKKLRDLTDEAEVCEAIQAPLGKEIPTQILEEDPLE